MLPFGFRHDLIDRYESKIMKRLFELRITHNILDDLVVVLDLMD